MRNRVLGMLAVLVMAGAAVAYAQAIGAANVQIGFPFTVAGKDLPAGKYSVEVTEAGVVTVKGPGGVSQSLAAITTLGRHDKDPDPELVFDKVGGKNLLSEVWFPGNEGFLLLATKGAHQHAVVGGSNPRN
jgi:hypothetical protein